MTGVTNVSFHRASVDESVLPAGSQDFGYALGVLHHLPNPAGGIAACTALLKPGAPFLVYLYYALENRSSAYKRLWRLSDRLRRIICKLPPTPKHLMTNAIAALSYFPLARFALLAERAGFDVSGIPLSHYRRHSFYTMRTDSRDRFGTPLELRFTRDQIRSMLVAAGLQDVRFSDHAPFWCAVGIKS